MKPSEIIILFALLSFNYTVSAQTVMPLYEGKIPNSIPGKNYEKSEINKDGVLIISNISIPTLTVYKPEKNTANGASVIICPGGGYWVEAAGHEGADVAKKFNDMGITAFVLKYRIPTDSTMVNREIGPLQDAQRAIQRVRENEKEFGIDKNKIGIMGFSAGGHLASTAGTHYKHDYIDNPNHTSLRPDFMILVYPVITFTEPIGNGGSREQLLGKHPTAEKIKAYSNELQVTKDTPPAFLVQAKDDPIKYENATMFADALRNHDVPAEVYLYERGAHGFGMDNKTSPVKWMDLVHAWMKKVIY